MFKNDCFSNAEKSEVNVILSRDFTGLNKKLAQFIHENIKQNHNVLNNFFFQLADLFPGIVHIKEIHKHSYIAGNRYWMNLYHFSSLDDFINKNVFDFDKTIKNRWDKDFAERIYQADIEIIKSGKPIFAYNESYLDDRGFLIVESLNKVPLFNENDEMFAIMTTGINQAKEINKAYLKELYKKIYKNKKDAITHFLLHLGLNRFIKKTPSGYIPISERKLDCLTLLASGKTAKEVAQRLSISQRTVESYIDFIKETFNFNSTSEMIDEFSYYFNRA